MILPNRDLSAYNILSFSLWPVCYLYSRQLQLHQYGSVPSGSTRMWEYKFLLLLGKARLTTKGLVQKLYCHIIWALYHDIRLCLMGYTSSSSTLCAFWGFSEFILYFSGHYAAWPNLFTWVQQNLYSGFLMQWSLGNIFCLSNLSCPT